MTIWDVPKELISKTDEELIKDYNKLSLRQLLEKKQMEYELRSKEANVRLKNVERKLDILSNKIRNLEKIIIRHVDEGYDVRLSFKRWFNNRMRAVE